MALVPDTLLEKLNSLIVVLNPQGNVDYVSPSVKRILGFEPMELMGNGWWELTRDNDQDRDEIRSLALKQLKQEILLETVPYERLLKTATGGNKWILWNTSKGPAGTLVGIGHDITDRKKAEEQLLEKHKALEQQNKEMKESITYASRIQEAILPDPRLFLLDFADAFVLYQPKDVVSGDYYYYFKRGKKTYVAAIDCTGHGVPGALMSVIANGLLKEVIVKKGLEDAAEILYALDEELYAVLNKDGKATASDGMDVALAIFDHENFTVNFAGAFRPLLIVRDEEVIEIEANRYPIGFYGDTAKQFKAELFSYQEGDHFYFFTDGYCDQFGGEHKKKLNRRRFKELVLSIQSMDMEEQKSFLQYALRNWMQDEPQVDDILVLGIKI